MGLLLSAALKGVRSGESRAIRSLRDREGLGGGCLLVCDMGGGVDKDARGLGGRTQSLEAFSRGIGKT